MVLLLNKDYYDENNNDSKTNVFFFRYVNWYLIDAIDDDKSNQFIISNLIQEDSNYDQSKL